MSRGEDELLAWLRSRPGTELLGDDAARLPAAPGKVWIVATDSQIAGVHVPPELDPALLARRLLRVNLSDLAASGAEPAYALVAVSAPPGFAHRRLFDALLAACAEAGVRLAGGDLARSPVLTLTLTLLGTRPADAPVLSRKGARPGDALWAGATLGESAAGQRLLARGARAVPSVRGPRVTLPAELRRPRALAEAARRAVLRHLEPRLQLELGAWLGSRERAAAIDLSDGLARDLPRLARESGVGAEVEADLLPFSEGFEGLCAALGEEPIDLALGGGEDYCLLFALPENEPPPGRFECARIGRVTEGERLVLVRSGRRQSWPETGWDHLQPSG